MTGNKNLRVKPFKYHSRTSHDNRSRCSSAARATCPRRDECSKRRARRYELPAEPQVSCVSCIKLPQVSSSTAMIEPVVDVTGLVNFTPDVLACPRCGGRVGVIATVLAPLAVRALLAHLAPSGAPAPPGPAPPAPAPYVVRACRPLSTLPLTPAAPPRPLFDRQPRPCPMTWGPPAITMPTRAFAHPRTADRALLGPVPGSWIAAGEQSWTGATSATPAESRDWFL